MSIKTVLFDLDGTLLPMDQEAFIEKYFGTMAMRLAQHGYDPKELIKGVTAGIYAMMGNTGEKTNEAAFWDAFAGVFGEKARGDLPIFEAYYREVFDEVKTSCGYTPKAAQIIAKVKELGFQAVLATNPMFPRIATGKRIRWAGLEPEDFVLYTTYEDYSYCKPDLRYYEEILEKLGLKAEECLMVGNDVGEDMIARELGMDVFLLTDCLINRVGKDIGEYPNGSFEELTAYLENLTK